MSLQRKIIHLDMDAFFAAIEERDNSEYRGKPLVVGGSPKKRGVVATANYAARQFGISSAMPSSHALRLCPQVVFVTPRMDLYRLVSKEIMEILRGYSDLVEPVSLDEAYIDVTTHKTELLSATEIAKAMKEAVLQKTRLTASAGVAPNKFLAKVASDMNKPDGLTVIRPEKVLSVLENLSVRKIPGIGKVTAKKMAEMEIYTAGDLGKWSEEDLRRTFGKIGIWFYKVARGIDDRLVVQEHERKSLSVEDTFDTDIVDLAFLKEELVSLASRIVKRMKRTNYSGKTLTLKVTYSDFTKVTRSKTFDQLLLDEKEIAEGCSFLISQTEAGKRPVRLLGVAIGNLQNQEFSTSSPVKKNTQLTLL